MSLATTISQEMLTEIVTPAGSCRKKYTLSMLNLKNWLFLLGTLQTDVIMWIRIMIILILRQPEVSSHRLDCVYLEWVWHFPSEWRTGEWRKNVPPLHTHPHRWVPPDSTDHCPFYRRPQGVIFPAGARVIPAGNMDNVTGNLIYE